MIKPSVVELLNKQITSEAMASQIYLQMSLWCEEQGLPGAGQFFRSHSDEELGHRAKLIDFVVESNATVTLEAVPAPRSEFSDLIEVINAAYEHEQVVTEQIHSLARAALDVDDFSTFNMLQWFVAEQREELVLFRGLVDFIALSGFTGEGGDGLVNLNAHLAGLARSATAG